MSKNKKLEQVLVEIKDIAEQFCNACQEFEPEKEVLIVYTVTTVKFYEKSVK